MKSRKYPYRRNLPHFLKEGIPHFATFVTHQRWEIPVTARDLVLRHCLRDNGSKMEAHAVVVMPDHVHIIFTPLRVSAVEIFSFEEIVGAIKSASAHSVNRPLHRRGRFWQDESFDHVLRSEESLAEKTEYLCQNPVRKGLVSKPEDYPWLWRIPE